MKKYVRQALKELRDSKKTKIEIKLKNKNDYKKNVIRVLYNKFIFAIQQKIVPSHFKNWLLKTTGMKVGHDVCIPHDITFDPYFPELITLGDGCLIGGESFLFSHQVKGKKLVLGKINVAKRVLVGGLSTLFPGAKLNQNSMLMFFADLDTEIPEGELWAGKPAKKLMSFSKEDIDKYHKPSNNDKNYYKQFRKNVKAFLKDPNQTYFKMHYDGKRLNAGNDWWRARCVIRIWYNGIIVEIARRLYHSWFKTMMFRMMGLKIGKNVHIGKGVVFDHVYGDQITIEDNVRIDDYTYLDCHEYTIAQTIFGKTLIKSGVHLKHHSYVRSGTTIGENTLVEPWSMAQRNIPPNSIVTGLSGKITPQKK